ncbi:MAG: alkaline phosphatase family protein [Anaerolineales bacterium]
MTKHHPSKGQSQEPQDRSLRSYLGDDFILPHYQGGSILNIADSVCRWFDIPTFGIGPLKDNILSGVESPIQKVVLVIVDAVSYHHFQEWTQNRDSAFWETLRSVGDLSAITSISPSTTCAAMSSLWTGQPAGRHGVSGYEMWMKEYSMAVNMIVHGPTTFHKGGGTLLRTGFDPTTFLPLPTLGTHLQAHGIEAHAFQHHSILHSGLSRTFLHDVTLHGINTPADMWISVRELLESQPDKKTFISAYWGAVDGYFHRFGPSDERAGAEFNSFTHHLHDQCLGALSPQAKKGTLFILTADHGQVFTPFNPDYDLNNHPTMTDMLHIMPTGENRLAYLHVRPGKIQAVQDYITEHWPDQFQCHPSQDLSSAGLFGPAPFHPQWQSRIGDLSVIAKNDAYLWWSTDVNDLLGRHGGLSEREMRVPFLTLPLS